jgi:hypothetical protein
MGNSTSTSNTNTAKSGKLAQEIDYIAANYITTQNFRDMERLADIEHCNNLVIMTADIIANNLNDLDVNYLAQRLKDGVEINEMTDSSVIYFKKESVQKMDVSNSTTKRRLCIGIAKFYVKVAHLFAAIVTTVNPIYVYKSADGSTVKIPLLQKSNIPKEAQAKIQKYNICSQRLNALINNQDFDAPADSNVTVSPKFCDMNYDKTRGKDRNLFEEPGIPELEKLYYDDYDYDQGGFKGMSEKMRKDVYEKDVLTFYRAFTGNKNIPLTDQGKPIVKKFSDILLRDFHKSKGCKKDGVYTKQYTASLKNKLFGDYASHIKNMMNNTTVNQDKLVSILEIMFARAINPETQRKEIIINPKMTEDLLQGLVEKARGSIVELYATCEDDFVKGLELFEAIVEKQIMDTSQAQIKTLEATLQDSLAESPTKSDSKANPTSINTDDIDSSPDDSTIIDSDIETKNSINSDPSVLSADASNVELKSGDEDKDEQNLAENSSASNNLDPETRPLEKSQPEPSQKNVMFVPAVYVSPNNNLIMKDDDDADE